MFRKALSSSVAIVAVVGASLLGPTAAAALTADDRIGGADRFETSALISRADPSPSDVVFLASGSVFSDALAAAPVAAAEGGRLLLSSRTSIPAPVVEEIQRLRPVEIVLVGGEATLGKEVAAQAAQLAGRVTRIGGADRVQVSFALLDRQTHTSGRPSHIWVVSGYGFSDALSAASVAARRGDGIVLSLGSDGPFREGVASRLTGVSTVTIAGGPRSVGPDVEEFVRSQPVEVSRIGGADRYAVSVAINTQFTHSATGGRMLLASGAVFTDGLSGAVLAGALGAPMYLTAPSCAVTGDVATEVRRLHITSITVLGGPNTVSPAAAALVPCNAATATATQLMERINDERVTAGLTPLSTDLCLSTMATGWAGSMARGNLTGSAHNPLLSTEARACSLRGWGENVGRTSGSSPDAERIMSAWMASEDHRKNILRSSFTHIGIGVDRGSNGSWYYVLDFGTR